MDMTATHTPWQASRRDVLAATGALLASTSVAGCLDRGSRRVTVLSAGSLARTFEDHVGPAFSEQTAIDVHGEYYGTNAVMRMVEDRTKHPDVIVSADATLLRDRLYGEVTDWDVEFATNSLGIGYNTDTAFGERLDRGEPWYEAALDTDEGDLSISDPNLDPLGYRAVQAFELAEREHDLNGFRDRILELSYQEPEEPQMMAGVETGSRAGAVVYRNMAVDHDMAFYEFPPEYNFADPTLADQYATVEFTTDEEEYTAEGRPIIYNVTINDEADAPEEARDFVQFLVDNPELLADAGLTVGESLPRSVGSVPEVLEL